MNKCFVFALVSTDGRSVEKKVFADNEKEARQKLWDILCDHHKDTIESIDLLEVIK